MRVKERINPMPVEIEPVLQPPLSPLEFMNNVAWKIHKLHRAKTTPTLHELFSSSLANTDLLVLSNWLTQEEYGAERLTKLQEVAFTFEDVLYERIDIDRVHREAAKSVFDAIFDDYLKASDQFVDNTKGNDEAIDADKIWFYPKAMRDLESVILKSNT